MYEDIAADLLTKKLPTFELSNTLSFNITCYGSSSCLPPTPLTNPHKVIASISLFAACQGLNCLRHSYLTIRTKNH